MSLFLKPQSELFFFCFSEKNKCFISRPVTYVWVNVTDGQSSHLKVYSVQVRSIRGPQILYDSKLCIACQDKVPNLLYKNLERI